ncbi:MAU2 chromatid cohesion factor homolog isoform X1 [Hydra vulgaris]|uniref:MAU2 chromatid cohesion factor homolog n=1 Tax=Hydra vulgaris TaxID=6087 RepID=T2M2W1_HYDVU|nr:MAU2 chromatid cohesion factor homolog [Hydra vulgaris]
MDFDCVSNALLNYKTLLTLAEYFRLSKPPFVREAIHCVQATLLIKNLPSKEKALSRLNLAKLLLEHTKNIGHARGHLEESHQLSAYIHDIDGERIFFESTSLLAFVCAEQNQSTLAKSLLRSTLERSVSSPLKIWHYRLIFQLAEVHAHDKEFNVAIDLLSMLGETTASQNGHEFVSLLFLLSKNMLMLATKDLYSFESNLVQMEERIHIFASQTMHIIRREIVNCFAGFLKVYHHLICGRARSAVEDLKKLQESIQLLAVTPDDGTLNADDPESFQWMSKEHLCILVFLIKVMHFMHSGCIDRAMKYADKALALIEKIKTRGNEYQMTNIFNVWLLEYVAMCKIIQGQSAQAILEISKVYEVSRQDPKLANMTKPSIHVMLGLYAMSMNLMSDAEVHFKKALNLSHNQCDTYYLAAISLAIVYIRFGAQQAIPFKELLHTFNEKAVTRSKVIRSAYFYMQGLKMFFYSKLEESKLFLMESLRISNTEDLSRMTACSLMLLSHVTFAMGNPQETISKVVPAMQLANKIPDIYLQLWGSSLLKDCYSLTNDVVRYEEGSQLHSKCTTQLLQDHYTAVSQPEHNLLKDFI